VSGGDSDWTLDMICGNMTGFEAKSEEAKRNTLGRLMYNKILELNPTLETPGSNMVAKVTAILIDSETFTVKEIVENLRNPDGIQENVQEAITIINEQS